MSLKPTDEMGHETERATAHKTQVTFTILASHAPPTQAFTIKVVDDLNQIR